MLFPEHDGLSCMTTSVRISQLPPIGDNSALISVFPNSPIISAKQLGYNQFLKSGIFTIWVMPHGDIGDSIGPWIPYNLLNLRMACSMYLVNGL